MFKKLLAIVAVSLCLLWGCSKDKPTAVATTGAISGKITDATTSVGITGATVTTSPATSTATTDANGNYTISSVASASYMVTAGKTGYASNSGSATVTAGNTSTVNIALTPTGTVSIEWVSIPAGNFTMGSDSTDLYFSSDEWPRHTVYLDAYQISKYEVTNAQYKAFMDAGGYTNSAYWTTDGWNWRTTHSVTEPYYWSSGELNSGIAFPNYPVLGVTWYEAYAFCNWTGGHLPTEAQWEKAARYTDARYYPWGSTWDASKCNSYENVSPDTFCYSSPVGYFTAGVSSYGVYDMAGNVWEWVNDLYGSGYYSDPGANSNPTGPTTGEYRVLRGGSYDYYYNLPCYVANRYHLYPDGSAVSYPHYRQYNLGFRPAK